MNGKLYLNERIVKNAVFCVNIITTLQNLYLATRTWVRTVFVDSFTMQHLQFFYNPSFTAKYRSIAYTLLLILLNLSPSNAYECLATAPSGTYRGRTGKSVLTLKDFCQFLGIRFGKAPEGDLRFEYPVLAEQKPSVVFNAYENGNACLQSNMNITSGSEDCLFLNVFTPKPPAECQHSLKPVLVFTHPGGFAKGNSSSKLYSPAFVIGKDIIFVTINYRLNIFGFLNYNVRECGGNMGLRDVVLALIWIQQNIRSFGGDPTRVTLSGESAGGLAAYLIPASPLSRGLLQRMISQSSVYQNALCPDTEQASLDFATYMNYKGDLNDRREIVRYLKRLPAKDLVSGYASFTMARAKNTVTLSYQPFLPSPDASQGKTAFFPGTLVELGEQVPDIEILAGQNNLDGAYLFTPKKMMQLISNVRERLGELFPPSAYTKRAIAKLKRFYFGRAKTTLQQLKSAINALTDSLFFNFNQQLSIYKRSLCNLRIWNYQNIFSGTLDNYKTGSLGEDASKVKGAAHGQELNYLYFALLYYPNFTAASLTKNDRKYLDELTTLWTNFVKTGNPNIPGRTNCVKWKPITATNKSHLQLGAKTVFVKGEINAKRRRVLNNLMTHPRNDNNSTYCRGYRVRRNNPNCVAQCYKKL